MRSLLILEGLVLGLGRNLCKSEAGDLADEHNNHLHQDTASKIEPNILTLVTKDEVASICESHNDEGHGCDDGNEDSVLALGDASIVSGDEDDLDDEKGDHGNHEASTDLTLSGVLDLGLAIDNSIVCLCTANDEQDHGNEHQERDNLKISSLDNDGALAIDRVDKTASKTKQHEDQGTEADAIENKVSNVEALVIGVVDGCEEERGTDKSCEGEDDEESPARTPLEAMLDGEMNTTDEEEGVDNDLSNGYAVVVVDGASHCVS